MRSRARDGLARARPTQSPTHGDRALFARALEGLGPWCGETVLDLGCGRGSLLPLLAARGARAVGIDLVHTDLREARLGAARAGAIELVEADAHALPLRTGTAAAALCLLVVHYLKEPVRALAEVRRVLVPGGAFVLADRVTNVAPEIRARRDAIERLRSHAYQRLRTVDELRDLDIAAGFEILSLERYEKRVPLAEWLAGVPAAARERIRQEIASWSRSAERPALRVEGESIVTEEAILGCRARPAVR